MKTPVDESSANGSGSTCSFIKTSLSMTSLPPDEPQDNREVIKAKLRVERPYNSLKKKRNTDREIWRHSWGSNNSHSSCSLHGGVSLRAGKDDFWAALQTNYNYIMDTNLLDTCREARGELEGVASITANTQDCYQMLGQSPRSEGSAEDPRELRKWLRDMENKLSNVPSLSEATHMSIAELQRRLAEHSVLYCEIVSHARVVGACVRASEKENDHSISSATPSPNGSKRSDGNLKGLERRYHLLYLKAIEVQCLFEGLLGKKKSSSVLSRASSTETDDEPASKLARLSDSESQTHASASGDLLSCEQTISDENKSEGDEEGEDWPDLAFDSILSTEHLQEANADFDADSEGSDCEVVVKGLTRHPGKKDKASRFNKFKNDSVLSENMDSNLCEGGSLDYTVVEKKLQDSNQNLSRSSASGSSGQKRQRTVDISKFNRSNRKSKNCAIFYFKHLDTDNENFGLSSQGSDALKSGEPSSDDEGWLFTNNGIDGQNSLNDDSDKENKEVATATNVNSLDRSPKEIMSNFDPAILGGGAAAAAEERERPMRSGLNHLKGEIHMEAVSAESAAVARGKNKNPSEPIAEAAEMSLKECSHESIKQLVINAENLVREEVLKTPMKKKHSTVKISAGKKREINMPGPNIQRVQEWLEHQPISSKDVNMPGTPLTATDCEASGEYTESDSAATESDTSEGMTDSIATCMQTGSTSQFTSTEIIGGSAEPITNARSNPNLSGAKVVRRANRRNSDRPWSVSCLSQLTEKDTISPDKVNNNQGLASHSISESALHILSSPARSKYSSQTTVKNSDSKNSLKRRRMRRRKLTGKKSDSGSDGILPYDLPKLTKTLMKSESLSGQINIIQDLTMALSIINVTKTMKPEEKSNSEVESEEEQNLMKPNFKLGSYTSAYMMNESKLGSLAALANYMNEEQGAPTLKPKKEYNTGTEDHSSFSEQAWDNYQEKYLSENYSEGLDSDAARRLLEFGDDYRNFLDSQSDCCSSLSAANNLDSLSPPRMDSLKQTENKITQQTITSSVDHARRRRALELEYERRRKNVEMKKKSQDEINNIRSPTSSSTSNLTPKSTDKTMTRTYSDAGRKLDFGMSNSATSLRRTSESDTSCRRRKSEEVLTMRRRSSRTLEKSFKAIPSTSSSSNDDSDDEKEVKHLLTQSRNRLENTNALKIRSHLLRPEDYSEIIATCRDNIRCLESVLRGAPGTVLSAARSNETRDLLSSWENLLSWSENAGAARQMQEEMVVLKNALNRLGKQTCDFDSESSIQFVIEELKNEKTQLQTYRTNMLRLNASVHSWLTRQEMKLKKELEALANEAENNNNGLEKGSQITSIAHSESEFHKHLKDEVSEMYSAWDEADARINNHLEALTASLIAWRQLECGLSEFHQVLGKDRGTLKGLEGALNKGHATPIELAQNVKLVAKLLSEKVDVCTQQIAVATDEPLDANRIINIAQFTSSNGSLSDSGISDGGATSDGGLSERERRLGVLRRLAKQLESALAPGSDALKSIAARMEAAEAELKTLQNTCRELIVRTAVSQHKSQALMSYGSSQRLRKSPPPKKKNKRKVVLGPVTGTLVKNHKKYFAKPQYAYAAASGDPGDPSDDPWILCATDGDSDPKGGWAWRVAKIAFPVQIALLTLFCAACLMEPHCCDSLNNLSMSFTPQLRYIRGPPPI